MGLDAPVAGDVVSVPLAKFEQLVELLAEVVRESKLARQVQPDLEQGNANIVRNRNGTNKCHSHCDFPHGQYLGEQEKPYRQEAIDELWNSAEPWDRTRLWEIPEEPSQQTTSHSSGRREAYTNRPDVRGGTVKLYQTHWEVQSGAILAYKIRSFEQAHSSYNHRRHYPHLDMGPLLSSCVDYIRSCDKPRLGDIILNCYQTEVLARPTTSRSRNYFFSDIIAVVGVLMINDERSYLDTAEYLGRIQECLQNKPFNTLLGIDLASLFQITHLLFSKPLVLEGSKDSTFATNYLNIKALESIGGLSIRWTDVFEDHLLLDLVNKTLFIAWFLTDILSTDSDVTTYKRRQVQINKYSNRYSCLTN